MTDPRAPKVSFVSLGCPKALVDSERIITRLRAEGYELTRAHQGADLAIVNTCGFLESAQAESLDAIGTALAEQDAVAMPLVQKKASHQVEKTHWAVPRPGSIMAPRRGPSPT